MKNKPKIKIFVAHHKPGYIYEDDVYTPIQVGKKDSKIDLGILGDDTGDNISDKNSNYAELTAQYWVWKNYDLSDVDYVGFCHYRRYMTYCYRPNIFKYIFMKNPFNPLDNYVLIKNPFSNSKSGMGGFWISMRKLKSWREGNCFFDYNPGVLKNNTHFLKQLINNNNFDLYTPKREYFLLGKISKKFGINYDSLIRFGFLNDDNLRNKAIEIFLDMYPGYKDTILEMDDEFKVKFPLHRHVFIMKKNLFLEYVKWMFDYLFTFEKYIKQHKIDTSKMFLGDSRFIGIFAEPLINYRKTYTQKNKNITVLSKSNLILFK